MLPLLLLLRLFWLFLKVEISEGVDCGSLVSYEGLSGECKFGAEDGEER